jgi:hypothetical protein
MFLHTDIPEAPWHVVESEDKRRARLNMIAHLISTIPYHEVQRVPLALPPRPLSSGYRRTPREMQTFVPDHAGSLMARPAGARSGSSAPSHPAAPLPQDAASSPAGTSPRAVPTGKQSGKAGKKASRKRGGKVDRVGQGR